MMTKSQQQSAEDDDDAHLDERSPVLKVGAFARAPDVDGCDDSDHHDGGDGLLHGRNWENPSEIFTEGPRQGGDGAACDDEKKAPAVEKGGEAAETVANVAIQTARFGIGSGEISVSERAEQREDAADDPDQKRKADGAVDLAKNRARRSKDAGANDGTDEEEQKIAKAECADEFRHGQAGAAWRVQTEGIITGDGKRSMGSWRNVERRGHEGEEKDQQSQERSPSAAGIESRGIVDGWDAEESHCEDHSRPEVPTFPEAEESEHGKTSRQEERRIPVQARVERTKNMTTIELGNGHEVQRGQ